MSELLAVDAAGITKRFGSPTAVDGIDVQVRQAEVCGPSKLIGLATITDRQGKDVPKPVFEFDGCFDPIS